MKTGDSKGEAVGFPSTVDKILAILGLGYDYGYCRKHRIYYSIYFPEPEKLCPICLLEMFEK